MPVCFVSARTGAGVTELLEIFHRLLPNPTEGNPPLFTKGEGDAAVEAPSEPDPAKHVLAHVFKVVMDPFVGKLGVFRVHQGTVTPNTQLYVGEGRKPFKVGHLFMLQGGKNVEIDRAVPGDIAAVAKVDEIDFDCVLHDSHDDDHIHMAPLEFPTPMHGVAIEPKRRGDEGRISDVLHRMIAEDPTLKVEHDTNLNETVLWGLGDLHLRSVLERMAGQFKLEVTTRPPRIPYRETITAAAEGHSRHKKQTGGAGQFGEVYLKIEPLPRGTGFEFVTTVKGGAIPTSLIPAVQKGVEQVLAAGPPAGLSAAGRARERLRRQVPPGRLEGSRVRIGRQEGVPRCDREGEADRAGTRRGHRSQLPGRKHGRRHRRPVVAARPGHRHEDDAGRGAGQTGLAPLVELDGYAARLKSMTGGQGAWSMELSHYEQAPPTLRNSFPPSMPRPGATRRSKRPQITPRFALRDLRPKAVSAKNFGRRVSTCGAPDQSSLPSRF